MVMMLALVPSWVVTRTTGPDSSSVKALLRFNSRMGAPPVGQGRLFARLEISEIIEFSISGLDLSIPEVD
jgi:hypothetical protein